MIKTFRRLSIACALATSPGLASASGFALFEANADGQGTAFAGTGVTGENASTIYFNPAAMTLLPGRQISGSLHAIEFSAKFDDGVAGNNDGGEAGTLGILPSLFYAMPVSPNIWFGLGISTPFGLKTEYDPNWQGRVSGIKSEVGTVNINPSIAIRINDQVSLGAGLDAMYIKATLSNAVSPGIAATGTATVNGDDWGFGFNLGVLYALSKDTRMSLAYRSQVKQKLKGDVIFSTGIAANGPATADITLPDSAIFSFSHRLNPQWTLLGDIAWTGWSVVQELRVLRDTGAVLSVTPEHWKDTMRYSLGAHYQLSERTKLRMGVGYDETPVSDAYRTVRIPDNDRTWLALGAGYKVTPKDNVDVAYTHVFVKDAPIVNGVTGTYKGSVDILGLQYTHTF